MKVKSIIKKIFKPIIIMPAIIFLIVIAGAVLSWALQSYNPEEIALEFLESTETVNVSQEDDYLLFETNAGDNNKPGFILYPGAQVDHQAYSRLAYKLADKGYASILVDMPFELAILGWKRASDARELLPARNNWYLIGHSLGGAMASRFISRENPDWVKGLILLAAYPANSDSLKDYELEVLSLYGNQDQIVDLELLKERRNLLPDSAILKEISGANHSGFADYGNQEGDGEAQITTEK
ncbi:MAG: alpha/beta hydrolase, partial [Halarsenatibacteraceae bacterium]